MPRANFIDNILNRPSQSYAGQDPKAATTKWSAPSDLPNAPQSKSILSGNMFQGTASLSKASSRGAGGSSWGGASSVFSTGSRFGRRKKTDNMGDDDGNSTVGGMSNAGSQATTSRKSRWWEGGSLRRSRAPSISESIFSEPSHDTGGAQSFMTGIGAGSGSGLSNSVHIMSATPGYRSTRSEYGGDGVSASHKRGSIVPPMPKHSQAALRSLTSDASTTAQLTQSPGLRSRTGSAPGVKLTPDRGPSRLKSFVSNPDMARSDAGSSSSKAHRKSAHGGSSDWRDFMTTMEKREISKVWQGGGSSSSDAGGGTRATPDTGVNRRRSVVDRVQRELQQDAQFEYEQREEGMAAAHGNLLAQAAAMVVGDGIPHEAHMYEGVEQQVPPQAPYVPTGLKPGTIIIEPGHQLYPAARSQSSHDYHDAEREDGVRSPASFMSAHDSVNHHQQQQHGGSPIGTTSPSPLSPRLPRAVLDRDLPPPPPATDDEQASEGGESEDSSEEDEEEPDRLAVVEEEEEGYASSQNNHELRQQTRILGRKPSRHGAFDRILGVASPASASVVPPPPPAAVASSDSEDSSDAEGVPTARAKGKAKQTPREDEGLTSTSDVDEALSASSTDADSKNIKFQGNGSVTRSSNEGAVRAAAPTLTKPVSAAEATDSDSESDSDSDETSTEGDDARSSTGTGSSVRPPTLQRRLSDLSLGGSFAVSQIMRTGAAASRRSGSGSVRSGSASSRRVRLRSGEDADGDTPPGSDASDNERDDASLRARIKAEQDRLRSMSVGDDFFGSTLASMLDAVGLRDNSGGSDALGGLDLALGNAVVAGAGTEGDGDKAKRDSILENNAELRMVEVRKKRAAAAAAAAAATALAEAEKKSASASLTVAPTTDNEDAQSFAASEFAPSYAAAYFALAGEEAPPPVPALPAAAVVAPAAAAPPAASVQADASTSSSSRFGFSSLLSHTRTLSGDSTRSKESSGGFGGFSLGLSFGDNSNNPLTQPKASILDRPRTRTAKPTTMGGVEVSMGKLLAEAPQAARATEAKSGKTAAEVEKPDERTTLPFRPSEVKIGETPAIASAPPAPAHAPAAAPLPAPAPQAAPAAVVVSAEPSSKDKPPPTKSALKVAPVKSLADTLFTIPSSVEAPKKANQKTAVVVSPASVAGSVGALSDDEPVPTRITKAPSAWSTKEQDKKVAKAERKTLKALAEQRKTEAEKALKREKKERKKAKRELAARETKEKELKQRVEQVERKEKVLEQRRQALGEVVRKAADAMLPPAAAEEQEVVPVTADQPQASADSTAAPSSAATAAKTRLSRGPSVRSVRSVATTSSSSGDERYATPEGVTPAITSPTGTSVPEAGSVPHTGSPAETALFGLQAENYHSGFDLRGLSKSSTSIRSDGTAHQEPPAPIVPDSPHMPGGFLPSEDDHEMSSPQESLSAMTSALVGRLGVGSSGSTDERLSPSTSEASSRSGVSTTITSPGQSDVAYNGTSPIAKTLEWADKAPAPVVSSTGPDTAPDKLLPMPPPPSFADAVEDTALRTPRGDIDRTPSAIHRAEPSFGINLIPPTPPALEQRQSFSASQAPTGTVAQQLDEDDESEGESADPRIPSRSASRQSATKTSNDSSLTRSKSGSSRRKSVRKSVVYDGKGMLNLPNGLVVTTVASSNDTRSRHASNDSELTMTPSAERKKSARRGSRASSEADQQRASPTPAYFATAPPPLLARAASGTSSNGTLHTPALLHSASSTPPMHALPPHVNVHMQPAPGHYRDSPPQSLSPYAASSSAGSDGSNSPAPSVTGSRSGMSSAHSTHSLASRSVGSVGSARSVVSRGASGSTVSVASDTSSRDASPHNVQRSARTLSAGQSGNARPTLRMSSINEWESSVPSGVDAMGTSPSWGSPSEQGSPYQLAQAPSVLSRRSSAGSAVTPAMVREAPLGAPTSAFLHPPVPKSRRGSLDGEYEGSEHARSASVDGHAFPAHSLASSNSLASQSASSLPSVPMSSYRPNKDPTRSAGTIDERLYARTTMSTIAVASGAFRKQAKKRRGSMDPGADGASRTSLDVPEHLIDEINQTHIALTSHTPPPRKISSTQVLVQVIAVAIDEMDRLLLREKIRSDDAYGWVPGRSFCGRIMEAGWECKRVRKGDIVFGLQDTRKCGALAEFMTIDHNLISKAPEDCLTTEQIAALPSAGVMSYQIMQNNCSQLPRGARVLILNAHDGIGLLTMQGCVGLGLIIVAQAPHTVSDAVAVCEANGAHEVVVGEPLWALNSLHESSFDLVIDTIGGRRIYDAARRILAFDGQFTTCFGDEHSMANPNLRSHLRSLRRAFFKKDKKNIGYEWVGLDGATGAEDCRQALDAVRAAAEKGDICPRLSSILAFADAPRAFDPVTRGVNEEPGAIVVRVS